MSALNITVNGQTQTVQLGSLSPAVNQQITQAVASAGASATSSATSATEANTSAGNAAASAAAAATSAAAANLFTAGVTDLGSITAAALQTFDMGALT